MYFYRLGVV